MSGWIDRQRRTVDEVAIALGRGGDARRGYPCPACGEEKRDDRRGAVVVGPGGGWHCYRCSAVGDGLDYLSYALVGKRLRDASQDERARDRDWCGEAPAPKPPAPPPPPRYADVASFWSACHPCPNSDPFLTERGHRNVPPELARFTPPRASDLWPDWWPVGRADTWRLVTRGWSFAGTNPDGQPQAAEPQAVNLHGRAIVEPPEFNGRRIKTLWGKNLDARGLVFWNQHPVAEAQLVLVCEGLTDWLAASCWAENREAVTVLGLTSGGAEGFAHIAIPDTADLIIATDDDPTGNDYAAKVAAYYRHRRIHRASPSRLTRATAAK